VTYTFTLEDKDAQMVLNALAELPYKISFELINNLYGQVQTQKQQAQAPAEVSS
jgi:hypothetical protein